MCKLDLKVLPCVVIPYGLFHKLKTLSGRSGIYTIYSKTEDKWYVGSAADIYNRLKNHFTSPAKSNKNLQQSILKHGKDDFYIIVIVFLCPTLFTTAKILHDTEQLFLDLFPKPKMFNIATHSNSTKGLKHSDETKALLRLKRLGKPLSDITKKKLSLLLMVQPSVPTWRTSQARMVNHSCLASCKQSFLCQKAY